MFKTEFKGDPIRAIGEIDPTILNQLYDKIKKQFSEKWVERSLALMKGSFCLKAINPTSFDTLDQSSANELRDLLLPLVMPYVGENQVVVYLDISSLPANTKTMAHLDFAWIHLLSKRLHIPLVTNPEATFAIIGNREIKTYNLKVGKVYEINNLVLHVTGNLGVTDRWHIAVDILDKDLYQNLVNSGRIGEAGLDPSINFVLSDSILAKLDAALSAEPVNS
jgi:hypothetical protein